MTCVCAMSPSHPRGNDRVACTSVSRHLTALGSEPPPVPPERTGSPQPDAHQEGPLPLRTSVLPSAAQTSCPPVHMEVRRAGAFPPPDWTRISVLSCLPATRAGQELRAQGRRCRHQLTGRGQPVSCPFHSLRLGDCQGIPGPWGVCLGDGSPASPTRGSEGSDPGWELGTAGEQPGLLAKQKARTQEGQHCAN